MRTAGPIAVLSMVAVISLTGLTGLAAERESPYGSGVVKLVSTEWSAYPDNPTVVGPNPK